MRENANLVLRGSSVILVPYRREHVETYHGWMQDASLQELTGSEPLSLEQEYAMQASWATDPSKCTFVVLDPSLPGSHGGQMCGDVNIYLNDAEEPSTAEIEIMIAEPASRRKGIASEALRIFMTYAAQQLGITKFRAKIKDYNAASIALFERLGYVEVRRVAVFGEVWLEATAAALLAHPTAFELAAYDPV